MKNGKLIYENNAQGHRRQIITAASGLPVGKVEVTYSFTANPSKPAKGDAYGLGVKDGHGRLFVNGKLAGKSDIDSFGAFDETFDLGSDLGSPVSEDYETPFGFTGKIDKITLVLNDRTTKTSPMPKTCSADGVSP